jgi:hypothetical protein
MPHQQFADIQPALDIVLRRGGKTAGHAIGKQR